jgi:glycerol-3-phosphate dehydrogenase
LLVLVCRRARHAARGAAPATAHHRAPRPVARRLPRAADAQILYYDGQFDDARLNVALAVTAAAAGAAVANYVEATGLIKVCVCQRCGL